MNINATLFAQAIVFAILIWVTVQYIWPPLLNAIEARQKKIADGLAAAERGKADLVKADEAANQAIKEARAKAQEILERAHGQANKTLDEAKVEAQAERGRQLAAAEQEIATLAGKARDQLRTQVAGLAVAGASQLLGREVDAKAHQALIDQLIREL
jgi:F-type H+-transporting ATPase subunit b